MGGWHGSMLGPVLCANTVLDRDNVGVWGYLELSHELGVIYFDRTI